MEIGNTLLQIVVNKNETDTRFGINILQFSAFTQSVSLFRSISDERKKYLNLDKAATYAGWFNAFLMFAYRNSQTRLEIPRFSLHDAIDKNISNWVERVIRFKRR